MMSFSLEATIVSSPVSDGARDGADQLNATIILPHTHHCVDRHAQVDTEAVITTSTPMSGIELPSDGHMHLEGTLRQRGLTYLLEERLEVYTGIGPDWTTPRIRRVMATDATSDAVHAAVDSLVAIVGRPGGGDARNRTSIVVDSIQPLASLTTPE